MPPFGQAEAQTIHGTLPAPLDAVLHRGDPARNSRIPPGQLHQRESRRTRGIRLTRRGSPRQKLPNSRVIHRTVPAAPQARWGQARQAVALHANTGRGSRAAAASGSSSRSGRPFRGAAGWCPSSGRGQNLFCFKSRIRWNTPATGADQLGERVRRIAPEQAMTRSRTMPCGEDRLPAKKGFTPAPEPAG